jgi:hypothetical protein
VQARQTAAGAFSNSEMSLKDEVNRRD